MTLPNSGNPNEIQPNSIHTGSGPDPNSIHTGSGPITANSIHTGSTVDGATAPVEDSIHTGSE